MLIIANPIYDVVFKYLMEDNEAARLLIGTLIGEKVTHLEFQPQEFTRSVTATERTLTVYHLDFHATIETPERGKRNVLIEIQKAKFATDLMRFRQYLGNQYAKSTLPIVTIYFLGEGLATIKEPVIKVAREYIDLTTGVPIQAHDEFIESLTHDSYIVQTKYLASPAKSEVERMLMVFSQIGVQPGPEARFLSIDESAYPPEYSAILQRLIRAGVTPDMRREMETEDIYVAHFNDVDRIIAEQKQTIVDKNQALAEKEQENERLRQMLAEQQANKNTPS